jgi:hypothetical protein
MLNSTKAWPILAAAVFLSGAAAQAATIEISITNTQATGGMTLTPLFAALHNGSYDSFDPGGLASGSLELLAEAGITSGVVADASALGAATGVATAPGGFAGAPVIEPGETATVTIDVDPTSQRYLSFLSMLIPTNDLFVGNSDPLAYEIFNAAGAFTNLSDIVLTTGNVYDAGTELNTNLGAPFNTAGGSPVDTSLPISLAGNLDFLLGQVAPTGPITNIAPQLATISVALVPLPPALVMSIAALGALGAVSRRRMKKATA